MLDINNFPREEKENMKRKIVTKKGIAHTLSLAMLTTTVLGGGCSEYGRCTRSSGSGT